MNIPVPQSRLTAVNPLGVAAAEPLVSISAAADGSAWAVTQSGQVLQYQSDIAWTAVPGTQLATVAAASDGTVCGINAQGQPLLYAGPGQWTPLPAPGSAPLTQVSVGSATAIFVIDTGGNSYQYNAQSSSWTQTASVPGTAQALVATSDGGVYALSASGSISSLSGGAWSAMATPEPVTYLAAGAVGWVWAIGKSGQIWQYDGSGNPWQTVNAPALAWITCGDDGTVWAGDQSGNIVQYDVGAWEPVAGLASGSLAKISVANAGFIWAVDASGNVYQYTAGLGSWQPVAATMPLVQIAAASASNMWGLDQQGNVYQSPGAAGPWSKVGGTLSSISAASDGTVWGTSSSHGVYSFVPASKSWQQDTTAPALVQVSVAAANLIVGVDTTGNLHQSAGGSSGWSAIPITGVGPMAAASAAPGGLVWTVNPAGKVFLYFGEAIGWVTLAGTLKQISFGNSGNVWGLDPSGTPWNLSLPSSGFESTRLPPQLPAWDTESVYDETRSTHLWIVNRAAVLAQQQGSAGQQINKLVMPMQGQNGNAFHDNLCQGIYDADFKAPYNGPHSLGQDWYMSHFYDPDTGESYSDRMWPWDDPLPNALEIGRSCFIKAVEAYLQGDMATAGYNLGLALHFFTDLSQPMHAGNFTYLSSGPRFGYHTQFEEYILETQSQVTPPTAYTSGSYAPDPDDYIIGVAHNSKNKYFSTLCPAAAGDAYFGFDTSFPISWKAIANQLRAPMLQDAITYTAQYLVAWMQLVQRYQGLSNLIGPVGGSSGNAVPKPPSPQTVPAGSQITGFTVWAGSVINGFQLNYAGTGGGGSIYVGGTNRSPKPVTIAFAPDEYIISIQGSYSSGINSLAFTTNKGIYPNPESGGNPYYGGSGGKAYFYFPIPSGVQLTGMFGLAQSYLNALGIVVGEAAPRQALTGPVFLFGPSGGDGGNSSNLPDLPFGGHITGLSIYVSSHVDAILVSYVDANGNSGVLPWQGGSNRKGMPSVITFAAGEFITAVSGRYDDYLESFTITTNVKTYGPYGPTGKTGGTTFSYAVWAGYDLIGFFGQAGTTIDALGCVLRSSGATAAASGS
jgi:phospholipase C